MHHSNLQYNKKYASFKPFKTYLCYQKLSFNMANHINFMYLNYHVFVKRIIYIYIYICS